MGEGDSCCEHSAQTELLNQCCKLTDIQNKFGIINVQDDNTQLMMII